MLGPATSDPTGQDGGTAPPTIRELDPWVLPAVLGALVVMAVLVVVGALVLVPAINAAPTNPTGPPCCGGGNVGPPLPETFALGAAREAYGGGAYWYNYTVVAANYGILWDNLAFSIDGPGGTYLAPDPAWSLVVVDGTGTTVGDYALSGAAPAQWDWGGGAAILASETVSLSSSASPLNGDTLVVTGQGSFAGSIAVAIP